MFVATPRTLNKLTCTSFLSLLHKRNYINTDINTINIHTINIKYIPSYSLSLLIGFTNLISITYMKSNHLHLVIVLFKIALPRLLGPSDKYKFYNSMS